MYNVQTSNVILEFAAAEESFEIRIDGCNSRLGGSLQLGITQASSQPRLDENGPSVFGLKEVGGGGGYSTFWLEGSSVFYNGSIVRPNYCRSLERLGMGDKAAIRFMTSDSPSSSGGKPSNNNIVIKFCINDIDCEAVHLGRFIRGAGGKIILYVKY